MSSPTAETKHSLQHIANRSYDESHEMQAFEPVEYTGSGLTPPISKQTATKVQVSGSITYVAKAPIGSAQSAAVWQVKAVDTTSGVVITWADGNANFDNVATDLTLLSYS